MLDIKLIDTLLEAKEPIVAGGIPEGMDGLVLGALASRHAENAPEAPASLLHIARDDRRMSAIDGALGFFAPHVARIAIPAWDCVPYDRISPAAEIASRRIASLAKLAFSKGQSKRPAIILTSMSAVLQRVPTRAFMKSVVLRLKPGSVIGMNDVVERLERSGYARTGNVMDPGEYAVRGGILDLFPAGHAHPVRLDFFGDTLESIRTFDPQTQRTARSLKQFVLLPASEVPEGDSARSTFRQRYVELFGAVTGSDPLYEAISAGTRYQGMEHWLPLFHSEMETLFDFAPGAAITMDPLAEDARARRHEQIADHYDARASALEQKTFGAAPYKPVPTDLSFLSEDAWLEQLSGRQVISMTPFQTPAEGGSAVSFAGKQARSFATERAQEGTNVFDAVVDHVKTLQGAAKRTLIACWSKGARERIAGLVGDHGLNDTQAVRDFGEMLTLPESSTGLAVIGLESGFETPHLAVIAEQDILGDRLIRPRRRVKAAEALREAASLSPGDLVVHSDHGIGRFIGLKTIEAIGAPHDCLELLYHGGDKLFLPVENIELLTRYGSDEAGAVLDRLGGAGWQSRKAKLKNRIRDMAERLIKIAAARELRTAPALHAPDGDYDEFCARFPFEETDDQLTSISAVETDLASGRPMDRLICGDVGFGKTEVAMRSAFITVMTGRQVAVVVPTTLLARQHYQTFSERFRGYPVRVAQASRLMSSKALTETKQGLADGQVDIVIGTHALLAKTIKFANLGLLIIDEEQHFGVQHKERLKQLRSDVHVLTLSATPIPRTLQLALTGVRELSLIATPPVDRLAVRTYVTPFDPVVLREALLRERFRGGQSFFVCPRIADLAEAGDFLEEHVPELRVARAHGQMASSQLEDVMNAFYDREHDVLLSTTIIESGLDIPTANTLIVYRSQMFGLGQLYQLRGRVGRSKTRAYSYFTLPTDVKLTAAAEKRLKVLQSLDTLGAGFTLASHDLDIRGAGNLLGEEQSGHIKEVGVELYQSMLEEAVAALREGHGSEIEEQWSPRISIGTAVLLPEVYVPDLQVRLGLYRRLSMFESAAEIEGFAGELVDRFGPIPEEVDHLLDIVRIKMLCRIAGVEQVEAGPKGAVIVFRNNSFANPEGLIGFIAENGTRVKLQPDHKLICRGDWGTPEQRLQGTRALIRCLAEIAAPEKVAA